MKATTALKIVAWVLVPEVMLAIVAIRTVNEWANILAAAMTRDIIEG